MEKQLQLQFEEERKRLIKEFFPENKSWWKSNNHQYTSTKFIASKNHYKFKEQSEFIIDNSRHTWLFVSFVWLLNFSLAIYLLVINCYEDLLIATVILLLVSLWLYQSIKNNFDKEPKIIIDKKGIRFIEENIYINWSNIVDTYIKDDNGYDTITYYLVIRYYNKSCDLFETVEKSLNKFSYSEKQIACMIELLKYR